MKNHYYPKALIKQWSLDNTVFVHKHYIKSIYANRCLMERSSSKKELCMTNIYNQYTEKYTARYDQMFVEHIRLISKMLNEGKINDILKILTEQKMIEMYYNILCRQPSLNKQVIDSTITEIQHQPYLMCSKNNPFTVPTDDTILHIGQWVNTWLHTNSHSEYCNKICYCLIINATSKRFILPDDTKPSKLLLSLSPKLLMQCIFKSKLKEIMKLVPDVIISFETDTNNIDAYNKIMHKNCNCYYIL